MAAWGGPDECLYADVNRDGILDILSSNSSGGPFFGGPAVGGGVSLLVGRGDGTFQPALSYYMAGSGFRSVAAEDADGDGDLDLVLVDNNGANVLRNSTPQAPLPGDANGDGRFNRVDIVQVLQEGKGRMTMCQVVLLPQDTERWRRPLVAGCAVAVWVALAFAGIQVSAGESPIARTPANRMVEIVFTATQDYRDAFHEVTLDTLFDTPQGQTLRVPAFWAGGRAWKVRYASPLVGTHRWRSVCSMTADRGLHDLSGTVTVDPYRGENPLFLHGPLRVAADGRHFEHLDKTPFFWLGDTWWMGLSQRLHWPEEFRQLAADRQAKGFTVIQIVAGLYPDMPAFDPRGQRSRLPLGTGLRPHQARVL